MPQFEFQQNLNPKNWQPVSSGGSSNKTNELIRNSHNQNALRGATAVCFGFLKVDVSGADPYEIQTDLNNVIYGIFQEVGDAIVNLTSFKAKPSNTSVAVVEGLSAGRSYCYTIYGVR